jgi:uncharacterized damage-inducible protein DinB
MSVQISIEEQLVTLLAERWEQTSAKLAELAESIPAEKFEIEPIDGIRTCAGVLRHVAFWNRYVADSIVGKPANDEANELPAAEYANKESILKEVRRSSKDVASVLRHHRTTFGPKTAELMITFIEHTSEHYGQLAVYARLMGFVPPASRT